VGAGGGVAGQVDGRGRGGHGGQHDRGGAGPGPEAGRDSDQGDTGDLVGGGLRLGVTGEEAHGVLTASVSGSASAAGSGISGHVPSITALGSYFSPAFSGLRSHCW
jgi:hypothetical protein